MYQPKTTYKAPSVKHPVSLHAVLTSNKYSLRLRDIYGNSACLYLLTL